MRSVQEVTEQQEKHDLKLQRRQTTAKTAGQRRVNLESENAHLRTVNKDLMADNEALKAENESKCSTIQTKATKAGSLILELETQKSAVAAVKRQLTEQDGEVQGLKHTQSLLIISNTQLRTDKKQSQDQLTNKASEVGNLSRESSRLQRVEEQQRKRLERNQSELQVLNQRNNNLVTHDGKLETDNKALVEQTCNLKDKIDGLESTNSEQLAQLIQKGAEITRLIDEKEGLRSAKSDQSTELV